MADYRPFLGLRVEHEYFDPDRCEALEFGPDEATRTLLSRAGLVFRAESDGFWIFHDRDREEVLRPWLAHRSRPFRLVFRVSARDPDFLRYSDLPQERRLVRLLDTEARSSSDAPFRLDRPPAAEEEGDRLQALEEELVTRRDLLVPPLAILVVRPGPALLDVEDPEPYRLAFASRRTVWRYHFLGFLAQREVVIRDEAPDVPDAVGFEAAGTVSLPGERLARMVVSDAPIPLRRRTNRRLQLREEGPGDRILVRRLPVPSPEDLSIVTVEGRQTLVSDIYVNS